MVDSIGGSTQPQPPAIARPPAPDRHFGPDQEPELKPGKTGAPPDDPRLRAINEHPYLGKPFRLLQVVARPDLVLHPLDTALQQLSLDELKQAYQAVYSALDELRRDPQADPDARAALNQLVNLTASLLQRRGYDPFVQPPPNQVRFGRP